MEKKITLKTRGMHCVSCEKLIIGAVGDIKGVKGVKSDYTTETTEVSYDDSETNPDAIRNAIEKEGYKAEGEALRASNGVNFGTAALVLGLITILFGAYLILGRYANFDFSSINGNTGILLLLLVGFLTGFHCIGMCGGFVLAYSGKIKDPHDIKPHLMYGAGKTISYTIIGAAFGLIGSVIAFTPELRGTVAVIAGFFLVLYGINMLNLLPFLRRFQIRLPSLMPGFEWGGKGPLVTGLMNGLMLACGPLQALYIFAAGTGSPVAGAKALFFFGLGTLVPMLAFGMASRYISSALTRDVVKFSGVIVVFLGLLMANNGLALLGLGVPVLSSPTAVATQVPQQAQQPAAPGTASNINIGSDGYQVIDMNVTASGWQPNSFALRKGVPVKWNIDALQLNGCNSEILVRDYGLDIKLKPGLQTVEFTPQNAGTVRWSCGMGMIQGQFIVGDGTSAPAAAPQLPAGHSCGSGGCGCGCGG